MLTIGIRQIIQSKSSNASCVANCAAALKKTAGTNEMVLVGCKCNHCDNKSFILKKTIACLSTHFNEKPHPGTVYIFSNLSVFIFFVTFGLVCIGGLTQCYS